MKNVNEMSFIELSEMNIILEGLEQQVRENIKLSMLLGLGENYVSLVILRHNMQKGLEELRKKTRSDDYAFNQKDAMELIYCCELIEILDKFSEHERPETVLEYVKRLREEVQDKLIQDLHKKVEDSVLSLV